MRKDYLISILQKRLHALLTKTPIIPDNPNEHCRLVISSITWTPLEKQPYDYTYFCMMHCGQTIYCTHTVALDCGILRLVGPYIFPHLHHDFVINFRFYRHTTIRNVYPSPELLCEATLNRTQIEQGKITLHCFDDLFGTIGFHIDYDETRTENIILPSPLSEWDSNDSSDS